MSFQLVPSGALPSGTDLVPPFLPVCAPSAHCGTAGAAHHALHRFSYYPSRGGCGSRCGKRGCGACAAGYVLERTVLWLHICPILSDCGLVWHQDLVPHDGELHLHVDTEPSSDQRDHGGQPNDEPFLLVSVHKHRPVCERGHESGLHQHLMRQRRDGTRVARTYKAMPVASSADVHVRTSAGAYPVVQCVGAELHVLRSQRPNSEVQHRVRRRPAQQR